MENMHQNDQTLIDSIRSGDQKAIRQLYEKQESYWFRLCLRYSRNRNEAQDIFQEGVAQVFRNIQQFDPQRGSFNAWSNRVIINAALQYLKKYQWQQAFEDLEMAKGEIDLSVDILEQITAKELIYLIQKLPAGYRMVFNLHEIEGYSHKEIAEILNIKVGTSKSQLSKAKKILQQQLNILF